MYVQDSLIASILLWAQERGLRREDYLFRSRKGGHITKQRADQIIKESARRAKLERNVHAHLLRHGYAINFLNCSGRLDTLQEQLGHRDINTTRIYLRLTGEDVKREVGKIQFCFPLLAKGKVTTSSSRLPADDIRYGSHPLAFDQ